ncbi:flagellar hook protein FlgE [Chromobacterium alkanivorans]|uniref:flagellar hook-basal body complex protein n=1 Tax=Chromobacterium alkanivorans TaxID=1071719 RepID=UPI001966E13E|nr:flagellar hook-basal body complex protein [Chromobacterium alkanivorans]MBN3005514.1 flagellar hook-basal body complex protein [Chromobacterium alkanivorans]MCS3806395.1 flagellar hook protein FlgE [Chromobacterium alkanivorans]MCS3820593.1 flagellar hook protein FlgE [Chromobacterium alkanivorans]MCS3875351.1 flagellar hook protein FlgE [Chromobacterium alkanivorans]
MIDTMFVGLSGLRTFQKGLSNIGNNVANLNTPGFKRTSLQFTDMMYQYDMQGGNGGQHGVGVKIGSTVTDFSSGELQSSANPLDVSVDGAGFLVSKNGNQIHYSRVGQFELDLDGALISRQDKSRIQMLGPNKTLQDFSLGALRSQAAKTTTTIKFADNLSTGATNSSVETTVFDKDGVARQLKISFTSTGSATPRSWKVEVQDKVSLSTLGSGEIRFDPDGSPSFGYNQMSIRLSTPSSGGSVVKLFFGEPGSISDTTSLSGGTSSTIRVASQDGYASGALTRLTFDQDGKAQISYSNGQTTTAGRLALAWFAQPDQQLERIGSGYYRAHPGQAAEYGAAGSGVFGKVAAGKVELSNVELSSEFSDMMITQRGYQAASQLISAANEMMQQALQMKGGR